MVIGIDYRLANSSFRGMGKYCREITKKLIEKDTNNTYILYIDSQCNLLYKLPAHVQTKRIITQNYILGEQICLSYLSFRDKLDVLWSPSNTFPLFLPKKLRLIVTIHDLIFLNKLYGKPSLYQKIGRWYRKWNILLGYKRINLCLTVSKYSEGEIRKKLGLNNIIITYNCIDSFYEKVNRISYAKPVHEDYFFTLSGDAPSKNLNFLIDIFEKKLLNKTLIIAGVSQNSKIRLREKANIIFTNYGITEEELIAYYINCKAFIFLSLEEGFGIPIIEAIICNKPIIASNTTSITEVVGECGVLVPPLDEESIIEKIQNIETFHISEEVKKNHLEKFMGWEKVTDKILNYIIK